MSNTQMNAAQLNALARQAIAAKAVKRVQNLGSQTIVPANTPTLTVIPNNTGLLLGFWMKVVHTINNGSAVQINLTDFGPLNALAQIQVNDFAGVTRIQTPGWHVGMINSVRARRPFGSALKNSSSDYPPNFGANWTVVSAPSTIAAAGNGTVTMWYWIPLAYSDTDLRGCIYANVLNAQMQVIATMPAQSNICVANGTDSTQAMYVGNAAGSVASVSITATTVTTYQVYLDQLPAGPNGLLLPVVDMATLYELKQTVQTGLVANQNFGYQYPNFRDVLSTFLVYVQASATGARGTGADINSFSLQSANAVNIWQKEPALIALETRNFLTVDPPPGVYYFGTRQKPIATTQYGNMQLIMNPITVGTGAYQLVAIEDFALQTQLSMAGSLASS